MAEHDIGKSDRKGDTAPRRKGPDSVSDNLKQVRDAPESKDLNEIPLDEHAALLTDARLSHPANTEQKTRILTGLQESYGNAYVQRLLASRGIQAKLTVNPPDDQYEQQADRVADAITQAPVSQVQRQEEEEEEVQAKAIEGRFAEKIQRQEMPEEEEVQTKPMDRQISHNLQRQAEEEEEEVQAKAVRGNPSGELSEALETRIDTEKGSGQPLSDSVRTSLEPHFGRDLSEVRVHTNAEADALSRQLGARAFTTGHDIFFGDGEYQPESDSGKSLISHEITHAVQQGAASLENPGATAADTGSSETQVGSVHKLQRKQPAVKIPSGTLETAEGTQEIKGMEVKSGGTTAEEAKASVQAAEYPVIQAVNGIVRDNLNRFAIQVLAAANMFNEWYKSYPRRSDAVSTILETASVVSTFMQVSFPVGGTIAEGIFSAFNIVYKQVAKDPNKDIDELASMLVAGMISTANTKLKEPFVNPAEAIKKKQNDAWLDLVFAHMENSAESMEKTLYTTCGVPDPKRDYGTEMLAQMIATFREKDTKASLESRLFFTTGEEVEYALATEEYRKKLKAEAKKKAEELMGSGTGGKK